MKLFIWEGDGISGAYHDDGMLVVLAESPEAARELVRQRKAEVEVFDKTNAAARFAWMRSPERQAIVDKGRREHKQNLDAFWASPEGHALVLADAQFCHPDENFIPDGRDSALDREPDRVVDIDAPALVAFNGGGYD